MLKRAAFLKQMKIRSGLYAVLNGKEYRAAKLASGIYRLMSGSDADEGFQMGDYGVFVRDVRLEELESVYIVKSYALFMEREFEIESDDERQIVISTSDEGTAACLKMDKIDRCDYRLSIPKSSADTVFEKKQILY